MKTSTANHKTFEEKEKKINEAIGIVTKNWGHVELAFSVIFSVLAEMHSENATVVIAALHHKSIRDIIESYASIKLKNDPEIRDRLSKFLANAKGLNKERNSIVHSLWVRNPITLNDARISMRNLGEFKMEIRDVSPNHLFSVAVKMATLSHEGLDIAHDLQSAVKKWRENNEPIPWPFSKKADTNVKI